MKKNAAELFPGDYEAQLIIIRQELEGRREMNSIEVPKGMKAEEFVVLRDQVLKTYESWQLRARFFRKELECQLELQKLLGNADEELIRIISDAAKQLDQPWDNSTSSKDPHSTPVSPPLQKQP